MLAYEPRQCVRCRGQFGFVLVYTGFWGGVAGCSLGLCVLVGFRVWLIAYAVILLAYGWIEPEMLMMFRPLGAVGVGHLGLATLIPMVGGVVRWCYGAQVKSSSPGSHIVSGDQ